MKAKTILPAAIVFCVILLGVSFFYLRSHGVTSPPIKLNPQEVVFKQGKISIIREDQEIAEKLEGSANRSGGSALDRVIKRKIIEGESAQLGIDLKALKSEALKDASSASLIRDSLGAQAASTYLYDSLLEKAAREKMQGDEEVAVADVTAKNGIDPKEKEILSTVADKLVKSMEVAALINSEQLSAENSTADVNVTVFTLNTAAINSRDEEDNKLLKLIAELRVGDVMITESPTGTPRVIKLILRTKGSGSSFEDWYQQMKESYLGQ